MGNLRRFAMCSTCGCDFNAQACTARTESTLVVETTLTSPHVSRGRRGLTHMHPHQTVFCCICKDTALHHSTTFTAHRTNNSCNPGTHLKHLPRNQSKNVFTKTLDGQNWSPEV